MLTLYARHIKYMQICVHDIYATSCKILRSMNQNTARAPAAAFDADALCCITGCVYIIYAYASILCTVAYKYMCYMLVCSGSGVVVVKTAFKIVTCPAGMAANVDAPARVAGALRLRVLVSFRPQQHRRGRYEKLELDVLCIVYAYTLRLLTTYSICIFIECTCVLCASASALPFCR